MKIFFTFLITLLVLQVGFQGCSESGNYRVNRNITVSSRLTPVKAAVFQDISGSMDNSKTSEISPEDLKPIIEMLRQRGGELAFGFISDKSNNPLLRLKIAPPPVSPVSRETAGNHFEKLKIKEKNQRLREEYLPDSLKWAKEINIEIENFLNRLDGLLRNKYPSNRTDIYEAINRAELFLNEPAEEWGGKLKKYAIIISDGEDNTGAEKNGIKTDTEWLLCNGLGSFGNLDNLQPRLFESYQNAISYIISKEGNNAD